MGLFPGLTVGASSLENASNAIQVIGNNIANLSTPGFKRSRAVGSEAFASFLVGGGPGDQIGHGANIPAVQRLVTQGTVLTTGNPLDLAVEGAGWFILKTPTDAGPVFTRAGNFQLDPTGVLLHGSGKRAQGFAITNGQLDTVLSDVVVSATTTFFRPSSLVTIKGNLNADAPTLGTAGSFTSAAKKDEFLVASGVNDQLVFDLNGGAPLTATIAAGTYTGAALASAVKAALEAANGTPDIYQVSYDQATDKFAIRSDTANAGTIIFHHDDAASTASSLLGFFAARSAAIGPAGEEKSDVGVAFNVVAGLNDSLSVTIEGVAATVTVAAGNYTGDGLAFAIETALQSVSSLTRGARVTYGESGSADRFKLNGPRTGGAYTIDQPSNAANPSIAVPATQAFVTGGTLAATTSFNAGTAADGTGNFNPSDPFTTSSHNTSFDLIDGLGQSHRMHLFFRRVGDTIWEWHVALPGEELVGPTPATSFEVVASGLLRFTPDGKLDSESTVAGTGVFNFDAKTGGAVPPAGQAITFDFGTSITTDGGAGDDGIAMFSSPFVIPFLNDGVVEGTVRDIKINPTGLIVASFTNGHALAISQIALALFPADDELTSLSGNLFGETSESGTAVVTLPGIDGAGRLIPEALEESNVEVGEQFVELIFQQQIFQANARVITTADEILQTLVNLT